MSSSPVVHIEKIEYHNHVDMTEVLHKLNHIIQNQNSIMVKAQEQFDALMARLNTVTNDIAADYQKLLDEVANGTVSQESLDAAAANITQLETLGASVENPVPPAEPPAEPPVS